MVAVTVYPEYCGSNTFTRFRVSRSLCYLKITFSVMPKITVSEGLYRQLSATENEVSEETLWKMVHQFKRQHAPSE
ncbi:hypothetical protein Harman_07720 [Haloarcula mannanilytica]|uniref:Uncharacterized protein n=1 Tax=Haloarcula mannanilytica TaxID=2509225 RepID=A0A4C2EGL3_9EURY|nr:hypothetical protein Harman_07720 [Haloarcula mannanilytica]